MHVLLINRGYHHGGGAEAAVRGLAELYKTQRHEVTVFTLGDSGRGMGIEGKAENGVQIYTSTTLSHRLLGKLRVCSIHDRDIYKRILLRVSAFLADWLNVAGPIKVLKFIKKIKPDVVHTHNLRGMGMLLPLFLRFGKGSARWIHTAHDIQLVFPSGAAMYPALESKNDDRPKMMPWYFNWYARLQRLVWGSPNVVFFPSKFLREFYRERGFFKRSKLKAIPNVLPSPIVGAENFLPLRNENERSILFIGALEESKGVKVLVEAVKHLGTKTRVDIVGSGSLESMIRESKNENVLLHGSVSFHEMQTIVSRALVTVVPSVTYENAPMIILESFRAGVPVIASRIGGIPEYVHEGVTGWLVEPGSVQELSQRIEFVGAENFLPVREDMRRNCVRKAVEIAVEAHAGHMRLLLH